VSYSWNTTRINIIKRALRLIGAISTGDTPNSNATAEAGEALNSIIKNLHNDGIRLFNTERKDINLTLNTVAFPAGYFNVESAQFVYNDYEYNVDIIPTGFSIAILLIGAFASVIKKSIPSCCLPSFFFCSKL